MAYEAEVLKEASGLHDVTYWTVGDATAIAKGTLMVIDETATRTAHKHGATSDSERPCGFAVSEKEASDGQTEIGVQRTGLVNAYADDTVDEGDILIPGETTANQVQACDANSISGVRLAQMMGQALQAASADGKFLMRVRL